jgi:hypothetical protein
VSLQRHLYLNIKYRFVHPTIPERVKSLFSKAALYSSKGQEKGKYQDFTSTLEADLEREQADTSASPMKQREGR